MITINCLVCNKPIFNPRTNTMTCGKESCKDIYLRYLVSKYNHKPLVKIKRRLLAHSYYLKNKDEITSYHKKFYQKNKEKLDAITKTWRKNNKDKVTIYSRNYYLKNKEKINDKSKKYYRKNRNKILAKYNLRKFLEC